MKKIALYLGELGNGGIESATVSQFKHFSKDKVSVDFIVETINHCESQYVSVIKDNGGRIVPILKEDAGFIKKLYSFFKLMKNEKYDVIHLHISYPSSLLYNVVAYFSGVKNRLATSHAQGTTINSRVFLFYQSICRLIYPSFCTKRIAVSKVAGYWLYGKKSFEVIPNAIDTEQFKFIDNTRNEYRKKLSLKSETLIGHVGRFGLDKNHQMILRVFREYKNIEKDAKLLLIGDGPLHEEIEKLAEDLSVSNSVIYIRNTPEVNCYMQAMDILLMPSLREACSVVVMEAQASSLPVLASDTIPPENKISELVYYKSLNDTPLEWANSMATILQRITSRGNVRFCNGEYPCDIYQLAQVIQDRFYL